MKLLSFGWTCPTIDHTYQYPSAPFDGTCPVMVGWGPGGSPKYSLSTEAFTPQGFTQALFTGTLAQMQRVTWGTHFPLVNVSNDQLVPDWFDDAGWDQVAANMDIFSWLCQEAGWPGVLIDTECYGREIWSYPAQPQTKTFGAYQDQVYHRGRQIGEALTSAREDMTILLTYSMSYQVWKYGDFYQGPYGTLGDFGLLPPFVDGLIEGADTTATIHDLCELCYGSRTVADFQIAKNMITAAIPYSRCPSKYSPRMRGGNMVYTEYHRDTQGWNPTAPATNYYQPAEFAATIAAAMNVSDEYTICYNQVADFFQGVQVSPDYTAALTSRPTTRPLWHGQIGQGVG